MMKNKEDEHVFKPSDAQQPDFLAIMQQLYMEDSIVMADATSSLIISTHFRLLIAQAPCLISIDYRS